MAAVTMCSDFGAPKNKVWHCFHCFPIYFPWSDVMIFVFWMLSFKPTFSLSSFTFIKRLFSSSSLSAIRVVSSAYLRLLIFLPAILIPACASSSPAFLLRWEQSQGVEIGPIWANSAPPPSSEKAPWVHLLQMCLTENKAVMTISLLTPEKQSSETVV